MVTLNVYVDIEPMSKIQNMLRVSPSLWRGYLGLRVDPGPMFQQKIREVIETLEDIDDLLLCFEGWDGIATLAKSTGATSITFVPFATFRLDI